MSTFAAIDFETANRDTSSACAVGVVFARSGIIVRQEYFKIRPPSPHFEYSHIHGLTWDDVRDEPSFEDVWETLRPGLEAVDFLAAHNASFDERVLRACCSLNCIPLLRQSFVCTVRLARRQWGLKPTRLPDVAHHLGIPLRHHSADSDAEVCAKIVLAAEREGWQFSSREMES